MKLIRAASKITVKINIPAKIVLDPDSDNPVTMVPVLEVEDGNGETVVPIVTSLHNQVKQGYLFPSGMIDTGMQVLPDDCYTETSEVRYRKIKEIDEDGEPGPEKYQYECEIPFYSYPSLWQKGDEHAAHFSLEIPWRRDTEDSKSYHPYYYQILINATDRCLKPNHWYDMIVNVGVIGSSVELTPVPLHDLTFYVMDWTKQPDPEDEAGGDRYEDLEIEEYTYFSVPQKRIEMNNTTVGELKFEASHNVGYALEWPRDENIQSTFDEMEKDYHTGNVAAYYVNCGNTPPQQRDLSRFIQNTDFVLSTSGKSLTFNFPAGEIEEYNDTQTNNANKYNIYSPVYVHLKVWLDINGDGEVTTDIDEDEFLEYVTFVYYPAMYIIPDESVQYSIYVNKYHKTNSDQDYIEIDDYDLGGAPGVDSDNNRWFMHVINVSSFADKDKFTLHGEEYSYIIGDPRVRKSDTNLNNDGYNMSASSQWNANGTARGWAEDYKGDVLEHYYPTSTEGETFRVVSPKFRISSKLGGYSSSCHEGAAMRCASYQENGYPAGRWRLPTTAEIMFLVDLQSKGVIQMLFYTANNSNTYYYSATHRIQNKSATTISDDLSVDASVRCVYDEWYWGSEQEAVKSTAARPATGDEYEFTWGDRQIWPE